jgi:hypothetical protein
VWSTPAARSRAIIDDGVLAEEPQRRRVSALIIAAWR